MNEPILKGRLQLGQNIMWTATCRRCGAKGWHMPAAGSHSYEYLYDEVAMKMSYEEFRKQMKIVEPPRYFSHGGTHRFWVVAPAVPPAACPECGKVLHEAAAGLNADGTPKGWIPGAEGVYLIPPRAVVEALS